MKPPSFLIACLGLSLTSAPLCLPAQTIAEKKESFQRSDSDLNPETLEQLRNVNQDLEENRYELSELYKQAEALFQSGADLQHYTPLLDQIRKLKAEIAQIQTMWRDETSSLMLNEEYALWHQPETSLHQLVMDYGAADYVYIVPPEVGGMRMSLNSNLPIPRESWGECLELILNQYGIGIRELNPYIRELYILRNDPSGVKAIVDDPQQLDFYAPTARICYVLSSGNTDPRSEQLFLQKFSNPTTTKIEIIGGRIYITASVETIEELLKVYAFAGTGGKRQDFQLISLSKISAKEMEIILNSAFHDGKVSAEGSTLRVLPLESLSHALFLTGSKSDVTKALTLIEDVESQIESPQEKTVFWYTVKHSDPEELAAVLAKVYDVLMGNAIQGAKESKPEKKETPKKGEAALIIPPANIGATSGNKRTAHKTADGQNNFIVDPKTGAIIMVIDAPALPKIKELLKKLDVPKKMVQLEVLLFEKKVSNSNNFGLNLLKLGSQAKNVAQTGLSWGTGSASGGILDFLVSRKSGSGIPAYDLTYQFMLGQEDVQINASPSVTTMNQTPAKIAIVEEVSIDSGSDKNENRIFNRAQYGIVIEITPTINMDEESEDENEVAYVTLDTNITFDNPKKNHDDRPDVTRRLIQNHVRIADGQTVILGGLRRKISQDTKDSIPFLGEIPGLGKLFSHTETTDSSTEMFVFITPKIISDPIEDAEMLRRAELKKRPGDIPEYLQELISAQEKEKKRLFQGTLTALFGREKSTNAQASKRAEEYDGR
ncbi:MAG: Type 3 secretion system secretin [Chlamydiales bacterium]|nr:Type 3 secretion system secretin [Chlamydiales bacterium]